MPDLNKGRVRDLAAKLLGAQGDKRELLVKLLAGEEVRRNKRMSPQQQRPADALISQRVPLGTSTALVPALEAYGGEGNGPPKVTVYARPR